MRNLSDKIPGAQNFTYNDFVKSDQAIRKGIPNIPTEEEWKNVETLAFKVLQPIRNKFGRIRVTSGFRCVKLCIAVGSNKNSNHARGESEDIEPIEDGVKMIDIVKFIALELDFRELICEFFPQGWIHISYREGQNTKTIKLKDNEHNYEAVTLDYIIKKYDC